MLMMPNHIWSNCKGHNELCSRSADIIIAVQRPTTNKRTLCCWNLL